MSGSWTLVEMASDEHLDALVKNAAGADGLSRMLINGSEGAALSLALVTVVRAGGFTGEMADRMAGLLAKVSRLYGVEPF